MSPRHAMSALPPHSCFTGNPPVPICRTPRDSWPLTCCDSSGFSGGLRRGLSVLSTAAKKAHTRTEYVAVRPGIPARSGQQKAYGAWKRRRVEANLNANVATQVFELVPTDILQCPGFMSQTHAG
eukprot:6224772-Pyramimonas_sp.AAC.1